MSRRALILYASVTGNTEKVANQFERTLIESGWACELVKVDETTNFYDEAVYFDDFDLLLLGSPIHSSAPSAQIVKNLAMMEPQPPNLYRNPVHLTRSPLRPAHTPLGVAFVTYSGISFGPMEALSALGTLEMYMQYQFVSVVGKFACPGKPENKGTIDVLALELGFDLREASRILSKFEKNPHAKEFRNLSPDAVLLLEECIRGKELESAEDTENDPWSSWHFDLKNRPSERDLIKADIFLQEILEDYFPTGDDHRNPVSQYTCIG